MSRAELVRISRDWRLGEEEKALFKSVDCSEAVFAKASQFESFWPSIHSTTFGAERPEPKHIKACGKCDYYASECLGTGVRDNRCLF